METYDAHKTTTEVRQGSRNLDNFWVLVISGIAIIAVFAIIYFVTAPAGVVSWTVNGRAVGTAGADEAVNWPLQRGAQRAVARDAGGHTASVEFLVK